MKSFLKRKMFFISSNKVSILLKRFYHSSIYVTLQNTPILKDFFQLLNPNETTLYKKLKIYGKEKELIPDRVKTLLEDWASQIYGIFIDKNGKKYKGYIFFTTTGCEDLVILKSDDISGLKKISIVIRLFEDNIMINDCFFEMSPIEKSVLNAAQNHINGLYKNENYNPIYYTKNLDVFILRQGVFQKNIDSDGVPIYVEVKAYELDQFRKWIDSD